MARIFTGGVVVVDAAAIPKGFIIFFARLCMLNCLIIGAMEKVIDAKMQVHSIAPVVAARCLGVSALSLHLLVAIVAPPCAIALSIGFLALGIIHLLRRRIPVETFRVLADLSLLVPATIWLAL